MVGSFEAQRSGEGGPVQVHKGGSEEGNEGEGID